MRYRLERWWHRTGVWWFVRLIPKPLKFWVVVEAINRGVRNDEAVPEVRAVDILKRM